MRRVTKRLTVTFFGVIFMVFYCEFLIYYVVIAQCYWPTLKAPKIEADVLKVFMLTDLHMLGRLRGNRVDKWRREWQMHRAFQTILTVHQPDVVFVLGDIFDEGEWCNEKQFNNYVDRFRSKFSVPSHIKMYIVAGNHDIGFHRALSDAVCTEPDAVPSYEKDIPFTPKIDALSKEATDYLATKIRPRAAFGGHTHYGCLQRHMYDNGTIDFLEYSIPSFSWRNIFTPKYMLVTVTPEDYAIMKCGLPGEHTMAIVAVIILLITLYVAKKRV